MQQANPQTAPSSRTSREDWIRAASGILVREGIEQVKVLRLAETLGIARSSFYWFFPSREALFDALLDTWRRHNTGGIVARADRPAGDITEAVLGVFECWVDNDLFDPQLDFAIREWARRSDPVRAVIDAADSERVDALAAMFRRHGYGAQDAFIRARILYFTQIGYYALVRDETLQDRLHYSADYVRGFTGREVDPDAFARFAAFIERVVGEGG
jgi:AcrR family transcriptional regulator